jgi:hypothetical protein
MIVNLTIDVILQRILASSALNALLNAGEERPAVLNSDHREALIPVIQDAFSFQVLDILDIVTAQSQDDTNLTVEFIDTPTSVISSPSELLMACIVARVLHSLWLQVDSERAKAYLSMVQQSTALLRETFLYTRFAPGMRIYSGY